METEWVKIGNVGRAHGLEGVVRVFPCREYPERFNGLHRINLHFQEQREWHLVKTITCHGRYALIKFEDIRDLPTAERYLGWTAELCMEDLEALAPGCYYHFQLEGCRVADQAGEVIGIVTRVENYPANDVLVVQMLSGAAIRIPTTREVVLQVDLEKKEILVRQSMLMEILK